MSRARELNDISAGRIAAADHAGRRAADRRDKAETGDLFQAGMATLAMPVLPERNQAEAARAAEQRAQEDRDARRTVARYSMYRPHGCRGRRCSHPLHGEHRALRDLFLDALFAEAS